MILSRYVIRTEIAENEYFFDITQKILLPATASEEQLRQYRFLQGQEEEALHRALFSPPTFLKLVLLPTWECNLRCKHCCVIQRLKKHDPFDIDCDLLSDFVKRYLDEYSVDRISILFCGGEPLLRPKKMLEVIQAIRPLHPCVHIRITTNLTVTLGETEMTVLRELDEIGVSVDGVESSHNQQRKSIDEKVIPYSDTINNIKKLMLSGMRNKVVVQSSLPVADPEIKKTFFRNMLMLGVHKEKIKFGIEHPTERKPQPNGDYIDVMRRKSSVSRWLIPCCKYRYMGHFVIDNRNDVYSDFYVYEKLGRLQDSIAMLAEAYKKNILDEMPVLKDETCAKCPVIGYCWGRCSQSNVSGLPPSQLCDQAGLIDLCAKSNYSSYLGS